MTDREFTAFRTWARRGVVVAGIRMLDHLGHPYVPADVDCVLREAEALGWLARRAYEPSQELQFFGVGGFLGDTRRCPKTDPYTKRKRPVDDECFPCEFAWEVSLSAPLWRACRHILCRLEDERCRKDPANPTGGTSSRLAL